MAVRVRMWPFILRGVRLHKSCWEFERFIGRCLGKKILLGYNAKYSEISTFFNDKMIKQTHLLGGKLN